MIALAEGQEVQEQGIGERKQMCNSIYYNADDGTHMRLIGHSVGNTAKYDGCMHPDFRRPQALDCQICRNKLECMLECSL